jgi:hypothetical protein
MAGGAAMALIVPSLVFGFSFGIVFSIGMVLSSPRRGSCYEPAGE